MAVADELPKQFDHGSAEARIYDLWQDSGVFHPVVDKNKKPFCVVMPPPNVTGILHMGHVLDNVPQDVMTRWHRMRGFSALWVPGTDHAGIATQSVVIKNLQKEGVDFRTLGREGFIKKVWEWKEKHGDIIINQLKRLGCSCDWDRERFTMDEGFSRAVLTAFLHMYERDLIYKSKRMINWCTVCCTALSDDEVESEDRTGNLWHIRYAILGSDNKPSGEYVTVATTRPETMLGDTAVAVHPTDERYTLLHGKKVLLPIQNRAIPVICDEFVDPAFGTGVVKVTPSHDPNDYRAGLTHNLEFIQVIGDDGKMTEAAGSGFAGLKREEARKQVVAKLEEIGVLEKVEPHKHAVGVCYRCKSAVEPSVSDQWFVRMEPLAKKAKAAVVEGRISISPESEKRDYIHWMDNIQDWCISRQLWWGHRIPVYYCESCAKPHAALEQPKSCSECAATSFKQDEDVLDTWFSSQLWPFGTLGWPEKTAELEYWYPNTWLMSGRDILFFWDSRMIIAGLELMGDVPFRKLVLHGLVRDEHGRKLSKSLGNSPDPLELFNRLGTDAVRASISLHYPMGRQDTRLGEQVYQRGQALVTKLWNATRFILMSVESGGVSFDSTQLQFTEFEDAWIVSRLRAAIEDHDRYLNQSDFVHASEAINSFFWNDYCDWYLEIIKPRVRAGGESQLKALQVALFCHRTLLKLFHPYVPFVTEELWQNLAKVGIVDQGETQEKVLLALAQWPEVDKFPHAPEVEAKMTVVMSIIRGARDVRQNLVLPPKAELKLTLAFSDEQSKQSFSAQERIVRELGFVSTLEYTLAVNAIKGHVPFRFDGGVGFALVPDGIDLKDIAAKLDQKIAKTEKGLQGISHKLSNAEFVANAPADLVETTKAQVVEMQRSLDSLREFRNSL